MTSSDIGVQPTRTARRGDQRRVSRRYETRNLGQLRSALPRDAAPHEHIKNVLEQLGPGWARFVEGTRAYHITMHVVSKGSTPGLALDGAEVERLATIRAALDVDMYAEGGSGKAMPS